MIVRPRDRSVPPHDEAGHEQHRRHEPEPRTRSRESADRRSCRRAAGAIQRTIVSPMVRRVTVWCGKRAPERRSRYTEIKLQRTRASGCGPRTSPGMPHARQTATPPARRARRDARACAIAIISRHDGACRAGHRRDSTRVHDSASAARRRRNQRTCQRREGEIHPGDRPHQDQHHAPDADGAMHLPQEPVAASREVDRHRAPPRLASWPPDADAGDAHQRATAAAPSAVDGASASVRPTGRNADPGGVRTTRASQAVRRGFPCSPVGSRARSGSAQRVVT